MECPDLDHMKRIAGLSGEDALLFLWVFVEFWGEGWDNRGMGDVGERTGVSWGGEIRRAPLQGMKERRSVWTPEQSFIVQIILLGHI